MMHLPFFWGHKFSRDHYYYIYVILYVEQTLLPIQLFLIIKEVNCDNILLSPHLLLYHYSIE